MKIGFARVSTEKQSLQNQEQRLRAEGCKEIYSEKISGAAEISKRTELENMLRALREGDIVIATKIDRIARSTRQLLQIADEIQSKGAQLKFLDNPIDTTTPSGKLIFEVLSAISSFERELIVSRTAEGLEHARSKGTVLGRPSGTSTEIDRKIKARWKSGESWKSIGDDYGISRQAVYRRIKKWREEESEEEMEKAVFGDQS
jgi:DNA invertase Pin-like site-specific DNA recombinase